MENYQIILNSNGLCIFCLNEVKLKCKDDLFPLHHLTSKIGINMGNVFQDMIVPGLPHPLLDKMEVLANACEGCANHCENLLYKFQEQIEMESCVKSILDKMENAKMADGYRNCESPLAIFYSGIVDKLRKAIVQKLHLNPELLRVNQSGTGTGSIPNLLDIPGLPFDHICSYLPLKDIKSCSTASRDLRHLVFPSLINSSFISFENQSHLPAMMHFIKAKCNDFKNVNLLIKSKSFDDSSDSRSALLQLFQECGSHTGHLKLAYGMAGYGFEVVNVFRHNNSMPVLGCGKELLPSLKKLELVYRDEEWEESDDESHKDLAMECRQQQIKASLPFIKAVLENSPVLKELMLEYSHCPCYNLRIPFVFKLIGESAQRIDTLVTDEVFITNDDLSYLQSLNLKKVIFFRISEWDISEGLTNFLESQSKSLKNFGFSSPFGFSHFTFPRMESLEAYTFNFGNNVSNTEDLGPISYHTQLPKLKEINLYEGVNEGYFPTLFPLDAEPTTSVKVLRLLSSKYEKHNLIRAACAFKCLSKLEIPVASYLNECWKDLTGLEELTLHSIGDQLDYRNETMSSDQKLNFLDKIITGLPIYRHCSITTDEDIRKYKFMYDNIRTTGSLALLTKLRLLRLRRDDGYYWHMYDHSLNLSEISCRLVLMKMESLKRIDFCGYRPAFVGTSRKVLNELRNKMDLYFSGFSGKKPATLELLGWDLKLK